MSEAPIQRDAIDEQVERIVEHGVLVPAELKADFLRYYEENRAAVRAEIAACIGSTMLNTGDMTRDAIASYLRGWSERIRRTDAFSSYQQLMVLQGFEPVDEEMFRRSRPLNKPYRRYRRGRYISDAEKTNQRDCIAVRWDHIRKLKFAINTVVETWGDRNRQKYRITAINERAMLVLEPVDGGETITLYPNSCHHALSYPT